MQSKLIDSFIISLTKAIGMMNMKKKSSSYNWDIENLDKIRFYFGGLEDERRNRWGGFLRKNIIRMYFEYLFNVSSQVNLIPLNDNEVPDMET